MKKKRQEKIYIFGTGGLSRVVTSIIENNKDFMIAGFIKQNSDINLSNNIYSLKYFLKKFKNENIVIAIGENILRKNIYKLFKNKNFIFPNIISNSAIISANVKIGFGNIIMPNVVVNTHTKINNFCILNTSSILEHDCNLESYVTLSPSTVICGGCNLEEGVFIGANSTIVQYLNIEKWSVVGAASIVLKKIKKNTLNIGSPTKTIKKINKNYKVFKTNL